jgi:hypothetical protein
LQGEFSSILTKCPSHLILATFIILTISRSLYKLYIVHRKCGQEEEFSHCMLCQCPASVGRRLSIAIVDICYEDHN